MEHVLRMAIERKLKVVAIGGSAGSIEALLTLVPLLPAQTSFGVVVVVHLPADAPSLLPELLQRHCRMPVREAEPWMELLPSTVYVAPPGYHLAIEPDRSFSLSVDEPVNFARPSIDVLFASVADVYGTAAMAILLSGANADGAQGIRCIAAAGGLTIVHDPAEAARPEMPAAAVALTEPTATMPLGQIAKLLRGLAKRHG